MKVFSFFICLLILISCHSLPNKKENNIPDKVPNIILIMTDDQGYGDLSAFGATDIATPNIDQLGKEGAKYTRFYVPQSQCTPSRAGILTGCYPNRLRVDWVFLPHSTIGLNPAEETIANILKPQGYQSAYYGKWHLGHHAKFLPTNQGFDEYFGIPYSNDMWPLNPRKDYTFPPLPLIENTTTIDTVDEFLQKQMTRLLTEKTIQFIATNKDRPFFTILSHPMPHVPLYVSDEFKGKSKRGLYGDVIMEIDWSVEQILETLRKHDLDENTLVIFTSDNGPWLNYGTHAGSADPLREGKGTAWEGGQREPCIIYYPDKIKGGRTVNIPMMNIDILPTIAEITQSKLPTKIIDGKSMWDIWIGKSKENPQEAYYFYYHVNELHGIRYQNWKMYFPHRYRTLNGRAGGEGGLPVNYEHNTLDSIELYDLSKDMGEQHNIASAHPQVVEQIKILGDSMRLKLGDKLNDVSGTENRSPGTIE